MADVLTRKRTKEVVLRPLDGSGRRIVLFGLGAEELSFNVPSPNRRTSTMDTVVQRRRVSRKRFTVEVSIFEPSVTDTGSELRRSPDSSSVYEEGATNLPTTKEQFDLLFSLAQLHEQGTMLAYNGIALDAPRCAIIGLDTRTTYTMGRATLTLEEQPEGSLAISDVVFTADDLARAQKEVLDADPLGEDMDSSLNKFNAGGLTADEYRKFVNGCILESLPSAATRQLVAPLTSRNDLAAYGLDCLPLHLIAGTDARQLFPDDTAKKSPAVGIIRLASPGADIIGFRPSHGSLPPVVRASGSVPSSFGPKPAVRMSKPFEFVVGYANQLLWFTFKQNTVDWGWNFTLKVITIPAALIVDDREDSSFQTDAACDPPPSIATKTKASDGKPHIVKGRVTFGKEYVVGGKGTITAAFIGPGGKNPFSKRKNPFPIGEEINRFVLVIADYR